MNQQLTILLLEDYDHDVAFFEHGLRRNGFDGAFRRVADVSQATHYLLGDGLFANRTQYPAPNLIICDLRLPGMSGVEYIKRLRALPEFRQIPILVLSSSIQPADQLGVKAAGVNGVYQKPKSLADWVQLAREVLTRADHLIAAKTGAGDEDKSSNLVQVKQSGSKRYVTCSR